MKASQTTRKLTTIAMRAAVSIVLVALIRIAFPPAPFLEYDPADIPIFICTFLYGPVAGLGLTLVVLSLIHISRARPSMPASSSAWTLSTSISRRRSARPTCRS